jgi:hypothetical protein
MSLAETGALYLRERARFVGHDFSTHGDTSQTVILRVILPLIDLFASAGG